LCIARAIANEPLILLTDEPTGNLDPYTSWEIMKLLFHINIRGTTVVMASHDKLMIDKAKKRILRLERGRIIEDIQRGKY
jgi:cell division transport system ATP-binding protein